ncbi:PREDICTED: protein FAR1-RELATED SEQUENCE 6-like [Tarenaya hassleriana]|uniref:protein FAR1-RELATED SEQUENCE 6-like n=1 Tax=Tarenaya hassleriana TaxID=28532 RepID=UPI00053C81C0|nr:PREDICTED: protein FAR1-RELATED SEQUENCE 6-like [Tarenaya hassleriana]
MDYRIENDVAAGMMGNPDGLEDNTSESQNETGQNSSQAMLEQDEDHKIDPDSVEGDIPVGVPTMPEVPADEPYVGQEFDSEAAAHSFYNAYASHVGFVIRVSKLSRSRHDGSAIGRQLVCNKEGYRLPSKRDKIIRQRAETRVGCRAMILVRREDSGKWVITKFIKEHTHPLMPGRVRRGCIYDQYPNEHDKIQELTLQLAAEKKRAATYKRHIEMLFEQIEQQNVSLSKRIQHIVDSVREIEQKDI